MNDRPYSFTRNGLIVPESYTSSTSETGVGWDSSSSALRASIGHNSNSSTVSEPSGSATVNLYELLERILNQEKHILDLQEKVRDLQQIVDAEQDIIRSKQDLENKVSNFIDHLFWVIAIPVVILVLLCAAVVGLHYFGAKAGDAIIYVVSFIGLGGFIGVAGYLRKLSKLNSRLSKLESRVEGLGSDDSLKR